MSKKRVGKAKRKAISKRSKVKPSTLYAYYDLPGSGHSPKPAVKSDPSPNHASRQSQTIQKLVLHNTDGPLAGSLARLKDPTSQVSAHYVVDRNGDIYQLVADAETAWHSGNKTVNEQSIGIEIVAWMNLTGMTAPQEKALIEIATFVMDAYGVTLPNVIPHRAVKPTDCPGWVWKDDQTLATWKTANLGNIFVSTT